MFGACPEEFNFSLYARSVGSIDGLHRPAMVYNSYQRVAAGSKSKACSPKACFFLRQVFCAIAEYCIIVTYLHDQVVMICDRTSRIAQQFASNLGLGIKAGR